MGTKIILERQELQDLSDYITKSDYNYLLGLIGQASAAANAASAEAAVATKLASKKIVTFTSGGFKSAGTYIYDLAAVTGITNPDAWDFSIGVSVLGATTGTTGYGGGVPMADAAPSVSSSVSGHSAVIVVSAQTITGYHAKQSTLSFSVTVVASMK
jgi:hypothetical protein